MSGGGSAASVLGTEVADKDEGKVKNQCSCPGLAIYILFLSVAHQMYS